MGSRFYIIESFPLKISGRHFYLKAFFDVICLAEFQQGANVIKLFSAVIYVFLQLARVYPTLSENIKARKSCHGLALKIITKIHKLQL